MESSDAQNTEQLSIEQRLSQVEVSVRELQQAKSAATTNWLQDVTGSFADNPIFDEVLAYGRELRQADHRRCKQNYRPSEDE